MGIFDKIKNTAFDPAVLGGLSNRAVAADDPIWAPINGVSLEDYADPPAPHGTGASPTRPA